ncbi:hypothetical protein LWI29_026907 [Acer saccharum]|uniref:Uncharacterized protein n=1 Tax=Acer saccharum TaxID=4024 RepID=A0AA39RYX6_ACESA|nr:hypothetical protein LWI29_026907 [Acer saccharum]
MTLFQDDETSNGWPLGLEIMNIRLRVMEGEGKGEGTQAAPAAVEPDTTHVRTVSFTSFSSSNLDTEINQSTTSFFQDKSVTLGRLIGFKAGNGGSLYFPKTAIRFEEHERRITTKTTAARGRCSDVLPPLQSHRLSPPDSNPNPAHHPVHHFVSPNKTPLSSYFRSPVELSFCVETMLTYHTTTASALLTSMLSVSPRIYGWASEGR